MAGSPQKEGPLRNKKKGQLMLKIKDILENFKAVSKVQQIEGLEIQTTLDTAYSRSDRK